MSKVKRTRNRAGAAVAKCADTRFSELYVPEPNCGCWLWMGCLHRDRRKPEKSNGGYGLFWESGGKNAPVRAHRWAYERYRGKIPKGGWQVLHKCNVLNCVNPDHLYLGVAMPYSIQRSLRRLMNPNEKRIYDLFVEAAESGRPCPSTPQLMSVLGLTEWKVRHATAKLIEMKKIRFERLGAKRIVEIVDSGKKTEWGSAGRFYPKGATVTEAQNETKRAYVPAFAGYNVGPASTCRYPLGEKRPFSFCGKPSLTGYSYCEEHKNVCYDRRITSCTTF